MSEKNEPEFRQNREAWDKAKAESFSFGNPRLHADKDTGKTDLVTHETDFDSTYLESTYQQALKEMDKLIETGVVSKITIKEDGCEDLIGYIIGTPKFIINGNIHGDEPGPAIPTFVELVKRLKAGDSRINNLLIIPRVHEEAYAGVPHRGLLLEKDLLDRLIKSRVFSEEVKKDLFVGEMFNVKKFAALLKEKGFHISEDDDDQLYIDLNRQFFEKELNTPPSLLLMYPKARQLMRMVKNYAPQAKIGFSFHADNQTPDIEVDPRTMVKRYTRSSYVYDTPKKFPFDLEGNIKSEYSVEEEAFIKNCLKNFRTRLTKAGIPRFTGIDDETDEVLGKNKVKNGYSLVPSNEKRIDGEEIVRGTDLHDLSFETAMTRWWMDRYWAFETAGWMNIDQRQKMTEILLDTIVLPLMGREANTQPEAEAA